MEPLNATRPHGFYTNLNRLQHSDWNHTKVKHLKIYTRVDDIEIFQSFTSPWLVMPKLAPWGRRQKRSERPLNFIFIWWSVGERSGYIGLVFLTLRTRTWQREKPKNSKSRGAESGNACPRWLVSVGVLLVGEELLTEQGIINCKGYFPVPAFQKKWQTKLLRKLSDEDWLASPQLPQ